MRCSLRSALRFRVESLETRLVMAATIGANAVQAIAAQPPIPVTPANFDSMDDLTATPSLAATAYIESLKNAARGSKSIAAATTSSSPKSATSSSPAARSGTSDAAPSFPIVGRTFDGIDRNASGTQLANSDGDVSDEFVVQVAQNRFRVYDKFGAVLDDRTLQNLFTGKAGITPTGIALNPRVIYSGGIWIVVAADNAGGNNFFDIAVSRTSDPTGAWAGFKIDSDTTNRRWADYPMIAADGFSLVIAANMFSISQSPKLANDVDVVVLSMDDLKASTPTGANRSLLENVIGTTGPSPVPVSLDGYYEFASIDPDSINRSMLLTNGSVSLGPLEDVAIPVLSPPSLARQPGLSNLYSGTGRIAKLTYDGQHVWGVAGVQTDDPFNGGQPAIRVFEYYEAVGERPTLAAHTVLSATNDDLIVPSIDVDLDTSNNITAVIGMTITGPSRFPSAGYAVLRKAAGSSSLALSGNITVTRAGVDTYQSLDSANHNVLGDYSALVKVYANGGNAFDAPTYWSFQEFASAVNASGFTDRWSTQIAEIDPFGVIPGELPHNFGEDEIKYFVNGDMIPLGPSNSLGALSGTTALVNDGELHAFYLNADNSLIGNGTVSVVISDNDSAAIDPVVGIYDANTRELVAYNDDIASDQDNSFVTFTMPSTASKYIIAYKNKRYTPGAASTTGDIGVGVTWNAAATPATIALNSAGDGSTTATITPATDSDFYRIVAPFDSTGTVTITAAPSSSLDGDLWVFPSNGPVVSSRARGAGSPESVTLTGILPGVVLNVTVQSRNFNSTGTMPITVNFATGTVAAPGTPPDMTDASDLGISSTDNITSRNQPRFTVTASPAFANFYARVYVDGVLYGGPTILNASGVATVNSAGPVLTDGTHSVRWTLAASNTTAPESGLSPALAITTDTVAPQLAHAEFDFETQHKVNFVYNENVYGATALKLTTLNQTTGQTILNTTFNAATNNNVASWTYAGNLGGFAGVLPDGNYLSTLNAAALTDVAGNFTVGAQQDHFFVFAGDATRDRVINFDDLVILAQNYNKIGRSFTQGNFNYSPAGKVNFDDLVILAQKYNKSLALPALTLPAALMPAVESTRSATTKKPEPAAARIDQLA